MTISRLIQVRIKVTSTTKFLLSLFIADFRVIVVATHQVWHPNAVVSLHISTHRELLVQSQCSGWLAHFLEVCSSELCYEKWLLFFFFLVPSGIIHPSVKYAWRECMRSDWSLQQIWYFSLWEEIAWRGLRWTSCSAGQADPSAELDVHVKVQSCLACLAIFRLPAASVLSPESLQSSSEQL